jgi:hypothetical protein
VTHLHSRAVQTLMGQRCELERSRESGDWARLRRGWCVGSDEFRQSLLERIEATKGQQHHGPELRESDEQKATRLVEEMLKSARWTAADLTKRPKGDPAKAKMARRLRSETTMIWPWIAEQLMMGHWRSAANAVRCLQNQQPAT